MIIFREMYKNIILTLFLLFSMIDILAPTQSYAMSLDDDEEDREDAEDYLRKAKQKANSENFYGAKEELKKARRLGVLRSDVEETDSYVQKSERNYEARQQAERDRQARIEAEKIEKAKQAELSRKAKELRERLARESSRRSYSSDYPSSSSSASTVKTFKCTYSCREQGFINYERRGPFFVTMKTDEFWKADMKIRNIAEKNCPSLRSTDGGYMYPNSSSCEQVY